MQQEAARPITARAEQIRTKFQSLLDKTALIKAHLSVVTGYPGEKGDPNGTQQFGVPGGGGVTTTTLPLYITRSIPRRDRVAQASTASGKTSAPSLPCMAGNMTATRIAVRGSPRLDMTIRGWQNADE